MSYQSRDESTELGDPILLFKFAQGSTTYRYVLASVEVAVQADGYTWTPAVMVPSEFVRSNDLGKDLLKVELASSDPLAATFSQNSPDAITTLTVFRTMASATDELRMYWKGRVAFVGPGMGKVTLNCEPVFTQLQRPGLRALYTKTCRHVLFGIGCNLAAISYETDLVVTTVAGNIVTLPPNFAPDGYWEGGMLTAPDGTSRMITRHQAGKLYLIRPIKSLIDYIAAHPTGATVAIFRGCDHSYAMCSSRFNNAGNFGGFPWFAQKNPFTSQVSFI